MAQWREKMAQQRSLYHVRPVPGHLCDHTYAPLPDVKADPVAWDIEQQSYPLDEESPPRGIVFLDHPSLLQFGCMSCGRTHWCQRDPENDPCLCRISEEGYPTCIFSGLMDPTQPLLYDSADGYLDAQEKRRDAHDDYWDHDSTVHKAFTSMKNANAAFFHSTMFWNTRIKREQYHALRQSRWLYHIHRHNKKRMSQHQSAEDERVPVPTQEDTLSPGSMIVTCHVAQRDLAYGLDHPGGLVDFLLRLPDHEGKKLFSRGNRRPLSSLSSTTSATQDEEEEEAEEEEEEPGEEEGPRKPRHDRKPRLLLAWMRSAEEKWNTRRFLDPEWIKLTRPDSVWMQHLEECFMALEQWLQMHYPEWAAASPDVTHRHLHRLHQWVWLHTIRRPEAVLEPLRLLGAYVTYLAPLSLTLTDASGSGWPLWDGDARFAAMAEAEVLPMIFLSDQARSGPSLAPHPAKRARKETQKVKLSAAQVDTMHGGRGREEGEEADASFRCHGPFETYEKERGTLLQLHELAMHLRDAIHGPTPKHGNGKLRHDAHGYAPWFFAWFRGGREERVEVDEGMDTDE
jgi:hypothetical protein